MLRPFKSVTATVLAVIFEGVQEDVRQAFNDEVHVGVVMWRKGQPDRAVQMNSAPPGNGEFIEVVRIMCAKSNNGE